VAPTTSWTTLILPGINDSGEGHWQTAWERLIPGARRVCAPDWERPVCADWIMALDGAVADAGPDVVLVAHSLGCLQVVRWAQQSLARPGDRRGAARQRSAVRAALLVAPPEPALPTFPRQAVGFGAVSDQRLPFPSMLVASADDPYATLDFSRRCAEAWGSQFVDIGRCGHVNAESGVGDWPQGQRLLADLIGPAGLPWR
jgi:predicted alpha/beta hydrolase family esterase